LGRTNFAAASWPELSILYDIETGTADDALCFFAASPAANKVTASGFKIMARMVQPFIGLQLANPNVNFESTVKIMV